ncbi:MAG TPA: TetR/AcrR family transcriptional regulator [Thermomonospora sp.]|nr:TetR/AcrR family transcriptional regulator [Thermomonospora sp.]
MAMSEEYGRRRAELLEALLEIAARRGLDEVSVREVAAQAGVSPAKVQYYFRTKDEMLLLAYRHVAELLEARSAAVPTDLGTIAYLREQALTWLPRDAAGTALVRVWVAFTARTLVSAELAAVEARHRAGLHADVREVVRRGVVSGELAPGTDDDLEATLFLALLDGLVLRLLCEPGTFAHEQAVATLDAHLAGRFRPT